MSPNVRMRISYLAGALALLFGWTVAASASEGAARQARGRATDSESRVVVPPTGHPNTYGTLDSVSFTIPAWSFQSLDGTALTGFASGPYTRYSTTTAEVLAPVFVPAGALISSIELEGCDSDAAGEVVFVMISVDNAGNFTFLSPVGTTGAAASPGCNFFSQALSSDHTVDNFNNVYYVAVRNLTNTAATSYTAMRVYYKLQVSPAPGTATFTDVPTGHLFFQFVEALAAAGITAGYPDGSFGVDDPITRGQMAVFLSKALGLHFAP